MRELKTLIVGVGGLGCPAVLGLAAVGVKRMTLLDPDQVELSNLHRQVLYSEMDLGRPKVEAAQQHLAVLYPGLEVEAIQGSFSGNDAERILSPYDLVIDGLDRIEKKFILNDWCVKLDKPYVHAGVVGFEGQVMAVLPGKTACLRCLIPKIPPPFAMPTCREAGVLGSFSQAIGYFQASEAFRLAQGQGPLRLWKWNALKREVRSLLPERDPRCPACGQGKVEDREMPEKCAV